MTTPVTSNTTVKNTGRSPDADLIYQQYVKYYNDINDKINGINQLPAAQRSAAISKNTIGQLVSYQQQLYPLYINHYSNSASTLTTFQNASASILNAVVQLYKEATGNSTTVPNTTPPSPIDVYTGSQPPTTTPTTPTTPTNNTGTAAVKPGRSPDADKIYSQYLTYYNDINTKINSINQNPAVYTSSKGIEAKTQLLALQQSLYPLYTAEYNNSLATLASFIAKCSSIMSSVNQFYNAAMNVSVQPPAPPTTPPPTPTTPPATPVTNPTTPTTPIAAIQPAPPSSQALKIENGTWYVDWTSYNYPIPEGVNMVNIFVGNMRLSGNTPIIDGFGTLSQDPARMANFIAGCKAKGIAVKISLGGNGGMYDNCWDVLTSSNVQAFAKALADFCTKNNVDGVDFDCEKFTSGQDNPAQQALVGTLIKKFKEINPNFLTSLCTNAGFGPNFPWQGIVENIMNASAYIDPRTNQLTSGVDKLYIMSYFDPLSNEQNWISGWADWLKTKYSFSPAQITVGINSDSKAYDVNAFAAWAASKGFSTAYWFYDPARSTQSNQVTNSILTAYKTRSS